jgi:polyhydroxyalkanoate synthase subunit PhaE
MKYFDPFKGLDPSKGFEAGNEWMRYWSENQKSLYQAFMEGKPPPFAVMGEPPPAGEPGSQAGLASELMQKAMEQWTALAKGAWTPNGAFDPEAMKKLFDPAEWKRAGSHFDVGLEKLTEGPTYATLWDHDKKMLKAQKLWVERARDVEAYYGIVQEAWNKTLQRFLKEVNDPKGEPITNGRGLLDLWLSIANRALLEMHRSEEFLEAQRRMTRSSAEYQLAEREIAETFCEMHHIPTRTEMDEVHRTVTELRRQLRALKGSSTPRPSTLHPKPKKRAASRAAKRKK